MRKVFAGILVVVGASACSRAPSSKPDGAFSDEALQSGSPRDVAVPSAASVSTAPPEHAACAALQTAPARGIVIELFTSEGCSSCPPADRLLSELAISKAERLFLLSFHVDYWNYLGWRDPYSDSRHSARQSWYASVIGSATYTPQMIVGGTEQFVGSRRRDAALALERVGRRALRASISLWMDIHAVLGYRVVGAERDTYLNLALVQKRAESNVNAGENRGTLLAHTNVVRGFTELELRKAAGAWVPPLAKQPADAEFEIVAFAQRRSTGEIVGVNRLKVPCSVHE